MNNDLILNVLFRVLGEGKRTSNNNYAFKCPNQCHPSKNKLEVNLETQQYQCWICGSKKEGFKGSKIINLLKKLRAPKDIIEEYKLLNPKSNKEYSSKVTENISLPEEFQTLHPTNNSIEVKHIIKFLKSRGISLQDVIKYNIGYCSNGEYANRIIIPSYDSHGKLNFFTGRSFESKPFIKYKNPKFSRDIIALEFFINWNLPLILCEGMLDAISIKRNAIPLLGKDIQPSLMKKIISSGVDKIYMALDKDIIFKSIEIAEMLLSYGKEVYFVDLDKKDPNDMGFYEFTNLIQNTLPISQRELMKMKILNL
jgi:DNA primase